MGKTTTMVALYDWFKSNDLESYALDLDDENKKHGSFQFWVPNAKKVRVREKDGFDVFLDAIDASDAPVILADLKAGMGVTTFQWFKEMAESVSAYVDFTMLSVVTPDISTISGLIEWAQELQDMVDYAIYLNPIGDNEATFAEWENTPTAKKFRELANPVVARIPSIQPDLMTLLRKTGTTIHQAADRAHEQEELKSTRWTIRSQAARRGFDEAFEATKEHLLPKLEAEAPKKGKKA